MLTVFVLLFHHTAPIGLYGVNCTACVQPLRGWVLGEDVVFQSGAAGLGVVGKDVDAVAGADGDEALELPFSLGFEALQKGEFAAEDFDEEVAVATGGLEEAAVEPEGLVAHEIKHGIHLAGIGEHLAMVSHSLAAFDLGFKVLVVEHKKSVNFCRVRRFSTTYYHKQESPRTCRERSAFLSDSIEIVEISVHLEKQKRFYTICLSFYSILLLF